MENNEEVFLSITLGYMKYKSQFYQTNKQTQKCKKESFKI